MVKYPSPVLGVEGHEDSGDAWRQIYIKTSDTPLSREFDNPIHTYTDRPITSRGGGASGKSIEAERQNGFDSQYEPKLVVCRLGVCARDGMDGGNGGNGRKRVGMTRNVTRQIK